MAGFAALGEKTRLRLVAALAGGEERSITSLTEEAPFTRQAISKHLRVLEEAGIVEGVRVGRENRYRLQPKALDDLRGFLGTVSAQWDEALSRLKRHVEE